MIFEIKEPTKKIKEICLILGSDYSIKPIDGEQSIYSEINGSYDLEVSGLNNNNKNIDATIFVWKTKPYPQVIETISDIKSLEYLKSSLTNLVGKYQNLSE